MAGLTVGLMSIDPLKFQLLKQTGNELDRKRIKKLEPYLKNHHFLLATIVSANCFCMELLPLMMEKLCPIGIAFLLSVTLVLVVGEIIPQALCLSDPLKNGARFTPVLFIIQIIFYPLAKPAQLLLDMILEHDELSFFFFSSFGHAGVWDSSEEGSAELRRHAQKRGVAKKGRERERAAAKTCFERAGRCSSSQFGAAKY